MNKKAQEATQTSFIGIFGIIIAVVAFGLLIMFVVQKGTTTASFIPAYVRDVGNIMEGAVSTSADVSVVYQFKEPLNVSFVNQKLTLIAKTPVSNKVFIPSDVTVVVENAKTATEYILIHKKGKVLTLAMLESYTDSKGDDRGVRHIEQACGKDDVSFHISTNVAELSKLPQKYSPLDDSLKLFIGTGKVSSYALKVDEVIIYYTESKGVEDFLCRFNNEYISQYKRTPVFIPTDRDEILEGEDIRITFSRFYYNEADITHLLDTAIEVNANG